jgi:hypothetical protein
MKKRQAREIAKTISELARFKVALDIAKVSYPRNFRLLAALAKDANQEERKLASLLHTTVVKRKGAR